MVIKKSEGEIFSIRELEYLEDRRKIPSNMRSTIKRRVRKKYLCLTDISTIYATDLLSEDEKYKIARNFFFILKPISIRQLISEYKKFEDALNKKLKIMEKWGEPEMIKREKEIYENLTFMECCSIIHVGKTIKNKRKFERDMKRFLTHPETILKAKITGDKRYIASSNLTKEVYERIRKHKKHLSIGLILSQFKKIREKDVVKEFYRRGILLEEGLSFKEFLNKCRDLINKGKFIPNPKSDWIEYDVEVFKTNKDYEKKLVRIPEIYKKVNFSYYSPLKV